jgi:hypothetical protein
MVTFLSIAACCSAGLDPERPSRAIAGLPKFGAEYQVQTVRRTFLFPFLERSHKLRREWNLSLAFLGFGLNQRTLSCVTSPLTFATDIEGRMLTVASSKFTSCHLSASNSLTGRR